MGRKKAEFKNLGTLPKGDWNMVLNIATGSILLACADHEPMVISDGKLTTLTASMGGKPDAGTQES